MRRKGEEKISKQTFRGFPHSPQPSSPILRLPTTAIQDSQIGKTKIEMKKVILGFYNTCNISYVNVENAHFVPEIN